MSGRKLLHVAYTLFSHFLLSYAEKYSADLVDVSGCHTHSKGYVIVMMIII